MTLLLTLGIVLWLPKRQDKPHSLQLSHLTAVLQVFIFHDDVEKEFVWLAQHSQSSYNPLLCFQVSVPVNHLEINGVACCVRDVYL